VGDVVIDSGRFDWPEERYPDFRSFRERKGDLAYLDKVWREIHINFGSSQAPFHSYLTLIALDTLGLHMERHEPNCPKARGAHVAPRSSLLRPDRATGTGSAWKRPMDFPR
jgi:O-acetylhomoserine (thiol)-lyase